MRTDCEVTQDDLIKPTVSAADPRSLQALQKVEELFPNAVTLTLNGSVKAATIDKSTIAEWLYINPDDFSPQLDKDVLAAWLMKQRLA